VSPWMSLLIVLVAGAGVAAIPFLAALAARVVDPDTDWGAPVILMAGLLVVIMVVLSPIVGVLALIGARTIAGYLATVEVVSLVAVVMLFLLLKLR
jgi:hypothetical protein